MASLAQGRGQGTTSPHPGPVLANHKSLPLLTSAFTPPGPCAAAQWLSSCSLVPRNLSHIPRTSPSCGQLCWERLCWGLLLLWEGWSRAGPGDQGKMSPPPGRAVCAGSDVTAGSTFFFFLSLFYVAYFVSCWEKPIPDWWPLSVSAEMLLLPGPLRGSVPALLFAIACTNSSRRWRQRAGFAPRDGCTRPQPVAFHGEESALGNKQTEASRQAQSEPWWRGPPQQRCTESVPRSPGRFRGSPWAPSWIWAGSGCLPSQGAEEGKLLPPR